MEKVKIRTAVNTGRKAKNDSPIIDLTLYDGRKGAGFDLKLIEFIDKEIELDIKEGKEYQGTMQYYFSIPREAGAKKPFPAKDWTSEKRIASLNCAVNFYQHSNSVNESTILATADNFFQYLNKK